MPMASAPQPDRKLNLIVFGINEQAKGTAKCLCSTTDLFAVGSIFSNLASFVTEQSVHNCYRMGHFNEGSKRLVLVKWSRASDITLILSSRAKLAELPGIRIKPDRPMSERSIESLLLKERRPPINSGTDSRVIKIGGSTLYVNGKKFGVVTEYLLTSAFSSPVSNLIKTSQQEPTAQSFVSNSPLPGFVQNLSSSSTVQDILSLPLLHVITAAD